MTKVRMGFIGAGGIGGLIGSLVAGRVSHRLGTGKALIGTMFLSCALNLFVPFAGGPPWAAILLLLHCTDPVQAVDAREDWSRNLR